MPPFSRWGSRICCRGKARLLGKQRNTRTVNADCFGFDLNPNNAPHPPWPGARRPAPSLPAGRAAGRSAPALDGWHRPELANLRILDPARRSFTAQSFYWSEIPCPPEQAFRRNDPAWWCRQIASNVVGRRWPPHSRMPTTNPRVSGTATEAARESATRCTRAAGRDGCTLRPLPLIELQNFAIHGFDPRDIPRVLSTSVPWTTSTLRVSSLD
jgi:hypothetical protein